MFVSQTKIFPPECDLRRDVTSYLLPLTVTMQGFAVGRAVTFGVAVGFAKEGVVLGLVETLGVTVRSVAWVGIGMSEVSTEVSSRPACWGLNIFNVTLAITVIRKAEKAGVRIDRRFIFQAI
ncbi:MAG: hypothetical protein ACOYT9_00655 [Patescibacteria group bacterium]